MNFIKSAVNSSSGSNSQEQNTEQKSNEGGGGFLGGIGNKLNTAAGGGKESEKKEDLLDKGPSSLHQLDDSNIFKGRMKLVLTYRHTGVDAVQQYGLGQGDQSNESAVEQAKDEQISDFIRKKYKEGTGSDFPIKDKETRFG